MTRTPATLYSASAWIKRRARRLIRAFQISRSEAVATAWQDWTHFHPNTHGAARHITHTHKDKKWTT